MELDTFEHTAVTLDPSPLASPAATVTHPNSDRTAPPSLSASLSERTSVELRAQDEEPSDDVRISRLPPVDGGFHAWAYLVSAWCIELLVWSIPFSYGIFLDFYTTSPNSSFSSSSGTSTSTLALVGSLSSGLLYLTSPIILPLINRYPWYKTHTMVMGLVLCVAGLVGAAYVESVQGLIITQGIMYSLGGSLLYFPITTYLFEWFSAKKGMANGVIFTGTGVGGVVTPFIVEKLLQKYGQKVTMLSLAAAFLVISIPCIPFIKPRLPVTRVRITDMARGSRNGGVRVLKSTPFWILFVANVCQGLGSFLPSLFLPTFASDLNLSTASSGTLALSLLNGASVPGLLCLGYLSDRNNGVLYSIILSSFGSAISVFFIWGFAQSLVPLLVFSCLYGFLAPSWSALWPRFAAMAVKGSGNGTEDGGSGDGDGYVEDPRLVSSVMGIFIAGLCLFYVQILQRSRIELI
ncbi:hypothetical protein D9757_005084 [Collybiopsis confluens]|uniref:MFS general substrate transporter n=1 Tax=Collybiopsis confluens TaxID=2823264 RepID=A0A8H5HT48_9AGAR|nr:hypothetical protein D9757_005084 [Collybiopsis confluens]